MDSNPFAMRPYRNLDDGSKAIAIEGSADGVCVVERGENLLQQGLEVLEGGPNARRVDAARVADAHANQLQPGLATILPWGSDFN